MKKLEQLQSEYRLINSLINNMLEVYGGKCYSDESISSKFEKLKRDRTRINFEIIKLKRKLRRS